MFVAQPILHFPHFFPLFFLYFFKRVVKSVSRPPGCQLHHARLVFQEQDDGGKKAGSLALSHLQSLITHLSQLIGREMLVKSTHSSPLTYLSPNILFSLLPCLYIPFYCSLVFCPSVCVCLSACLYFYLVVYRSANLSVYL